jgi:VCBS repeat-containing protein
MAHDGTTVLKAGHRGIAAKGDGVPADQQQAALEAATSHAPNAAPHEQQPGSPVDTVDGLENEIRLALSQDVLITLSDELLLPGDDGTLLEQAWPTAAGGADNAPPSTEPDLSGSGFRHAEPVGALGQTLAAAGALGATELSYGRPSGEELHRLAMADQSDAAAPSDNPPAADDNITAVDDNFTVTEDGTLGGSVLGNDSTTGGGALSTTLVTGPAHGSLTLNGDGSFTYIPEPDYAGPDSFTYRAGNGAGSSTASVQIGVAAVNDAPVAQDDGYTVAEDGSLTVAPAGLLANDSDVDGDALTAELVSGPAHGTLTVNADGSFSYTPDADYNGPDSFTYRANDGTTTSPVATVDLTVTPVNDAPVLVAALPDQATQDSSPFTLDLSGHFSDIEGDSLGYAASGLPAGLSIDPVTGVITGTIDHSASQGGSLADGIYDITVTVDDGAGGTASDQFQLTVTNPGPALAPASDPVVYADADANGSYDAGEQNAIVWNGSMSSGDGPGFTATTRFFDIPAGTDPSEATVRLVLTTLDNCVGISVNGQDLFNPGIMEFETGGAYVPATDAFARFLDGTTINSQWYANANGLPRLVFEITEHGVEIWGTRTTTSTVLELMQPVAGAINLPTLINGQNTIVVINDDDVGPDGIDGYLTVTTSPTQDRSYEVGDSVSFSVAAAFSDLDGDTLTFSAVGLPAGLSIDPATGLISGTLAPGAATAAPGSLAHTVTVTADDGEGGSVSDSFTLTAIHSNAAPVPAGDSLAVSSGTKATFSANLFLANDADPDGTALTVTAAADAHNGTVSLSGTTITYTAGAAGAADFTYTVRDGGYLTAVAPVAVTNVPVTGGDDVVNISSLAVSAAWIDAGAGNDLIIGSGANDTLVGNAGDDTLSGGAGNDSLDGGAGMDTADYGGAGTAVTANLTTHTASGVGSDTLANIENLVGSSFNDTLTGDGTANTLTGGLGNDTLVGGSGNDTLIGGAGNDSIDGGSGVDSADYNSATAAVTVNLTTHVAAGGAGSDTLTSIENVTGSSFSDLLTGDGNANALVGGDGNDTLTGGSGADTLFGGNGNDRLVWDTQDRLDGGAGFDTVDADRTSGDTIDLRGTTIAGVEAITTGAGNDRVQISISDVLSDTADNQFIADLGTGTDRLDIDVSGGWTPVAAQNALGAEGTAAGASVAGMTAYSFSNGTDTVTIFTNAEQVVVA